MDAAGNAGRKVATCRGRCLALVLVVLVVASIAAAPVSRALATTWGGAGASGGARPGGGPQTGSAGSGSGTKPSRSFP